ncbi:MAG: tripartite tricarboxylate transporter TctB family protein [Tissierellia bacterium]|nr:tripartite tricarboxylate transporter TctB family protein [Tissierellia bacterium]
MKKRGLEKGEVTFLLVNVLLGIILFILSIQIYKKDTTLSSQGAFPFILSILMMVMSALMIVELKKYDKVDISEKKALVKIREIIAYIFPGKIFPIMTLIVIYAVVLPRVGFTISTFFFLSLSLITFHPRDIVKSLLISAGVVGVILVIFQYIFKVMLP